MSNATLPQPTITIAQLRAFEYAKETRACRRALLAAKREAATTRAKVDAYLLPVFRRFVFVDDEGAEIVDPGKLYRCEDEALCARYYAACDEAHAAHGYKVPAGQCPALIAEHNVVKLENALLTLAGKAFGFDLRNAHTVRERALALLSRGVQFTEEAARGPELGSD